MNRALSLSLADQRLFERHVARDARTSQNVKLSKLFNTSLYLVNIQIANILPSFIDNWFTFIIMINITEVKFFLTFI